MTTPSPALTMLAAWLQPVVPSLDDETMARCRSWVLALAESEGMIASDLARAAFGRASNDLVRSFETLIAEVTPTYAPDGRSNLIAHLAGTALLHMVDQGGKEAVEIAGRCESLLFLGWVPVIDALPARISEFSAAEARRTRERIPLDSALKAPRRRGPAAGAGSDEVERLASELAETQSLTSRVAMRLGTLVDQFNDRLDLLDEEIDALWWARSERSAKTGQVWSELPILERAVLASIEVAEIVGSRRPTAGTATVLTQVIGSSEQTFSLVDAVTQLHQAGWTGPQPVRDDWAPFHPLASGVALMERFDSDVDVVSRALNGSLSLPDGHLITTRSLALQLLNENALKGHND